MHWPSIPLGVDLKNPQLEPGGGDMVKRPILVYFSSISDRIDAYAYTCACGNVDTAVTAKRLEIGLVMQLENKVAFITGGGSGLGLATAKTFIAEGAKVMIFDFNPKSQEVANEIGAKFVQGDVSKAESVQAAVAKTVEEFGSLDIAVASAGVGGEGDVVTSTVENWERTNGIDYSGVFYTNKYVMGLPPVLLTP
jgi:D-arabinose 1-dehydrogenase-like Zn-dependent alcohol dehydrogenase